ncbi:hypothetical protein RF11_12054 [Thelohanellus kitauei]|uniref:Uncharacterized protein n=1 Tax=Thelohanellus kitauei TaxID=669202 RepID=A0A0C2ITL6_THEKT|nr:hypothetical protein RF11_12054 [Thelohanellus kitauei]
MFGYILHLFHILVTLEPVTSYPYQGFIGTTRFSVNLELETQSQSGTLHSRDITNLTLNNSKLYIRFKNPRYDHWSEIECVSNDSGSECQWSGDGTFEKDSFKSNGIIHPCESVGPNYTYEVVAPVVPYREVPSHKVHISSIESSTPYEDRLSSIESIKYSDEIKTIPIDDKWNCYICRAGVCTSNDHSFYDHTSLSETEKLSGSKRSAVTLLT